MWLHRARECSDTRDSIRYENRACTVCTRIARSGERADSLGAVVARWRVWRTSTIPVPRRWRRRYPEPVVSARIDVLDLSPWQCSLSTIIASTRTLDRQRRSPTDTTPIWPARKASAAAAWTSTALRPTDQVGYTALRDVIPTITWYITEIKAQQSSYYREALHG